MDALSGGEPERSKATAIGLTAILMWSTLAVFGAGSGDVPPFLLNALCFGMSGLGALVWLALRGELGALRQPLKVWAFGTAGLFGYHFFYFTGLRNAPPVAANLLNYMWPLLIVVFSALLPGEKLRVHHVFGALLGLAGAVLLITDGGKLMVNPADFWGYGAALAAALFWSVYSVLSRRLGNVKTGAVAGFCIATSILSAICHVFLEEPAWPSGAIEWWALVALAIFPLGLSFFTWDHGIKRGDIQVLGAAAYAAPLISTMLLIVCGFGAFTFAVGGACLLITIGALVAAKDMIFKHPRRTTSVSL